MSWCGCPAPGSPGCRRHSARVLTLVPLFIIPFFFKIPAVFYLLLWFVTQVFSGLSDGGGAGVAWWAHIGGFVAGMLLLRFFRDEPRKKSGK